MPVSKCVSQLIPESKPHITPRTVREMMETVQLPAPFLNERMTYKVRKYFVRNLVKDSRKTHQWSYDGNGSKEFTAWSLRPAQGAGSDKHLLRKGKHWNRENNPSGIFTSGWRQWTKTPRSVVPAKVGGIGLKSKVRLSQPSENLLRLEFRQRKQADSKSTCTPVNYCGREAKPVFRWLHIGRFDRKGPKEAALRQGFLSETDG